MIHTNLPLISVIVPLYNKELFIDESLRCIMAQTLSNIEILIVDDGSQDKSVDIIRQYLEKDSRIKLIQCAHNGAAIARNIGIAHAQGEYLSFLDADDIFDAQMLEKTYRTAKENDSDIVVFQYRELDCATGHIKHHRESCKQVVANNNVFSTGLAILSEASPTPWNKLFRRTFIEKYQLRFQNLASCNDFAFTKCALLVAERVHYRAEELITYRRHNHSISCRRYKSASNIVDAGKEVLSFIYRYFPNQDIKPFYKLMLFHCAHEYRFFPEHEDTSSYLKSVMEFLPLRYRILFAKKIIYFRIKQCLRRFFTHNTMGNRG